MKKGPCGLMRYCLLFTATAQRGEPKDPAPSYLHILPYATYISSRKLLTYPPVNYLHILP